MDIDLTLLNNNSINEIELNEVYNIPKEYYENTDIRDLSNIKVEGRITRRENDLEELEPYIECSIVGEMIIPDSISLEDVNYPFEIEYSDFLLENSKKSKNTLDIFAFLWENILLEVPLQFTKVRDLSKFHGDGWRLISEDEVSRNNPFSDLLKDIEKE